MSAHVPEKPTQTNQSQVTMDSLDHLVLTVTNLDASCEFYASALGMEVINFEGGRRALRFGSQKINLHELGREYEPKAQHPRVGSGDLCFLTKVPVAEVAEHLTASGISLLDGPVQRSGAVSRLLSIYIRDPDQNLIEIANSLD